MLVLKGNSIRASHNNSCEREYFSLGGCAGPETQIHRASHNNSCEREYFSLGGCAGPERPLYTSKELVLSAGVYWFFKYLQSKRISEI